MKKAPMKPHPATLWQTARTRLAAALLSAFFLLPSAFHGRAAVVTGTIVDTTGTALVTTVVFQPLSNPQADAGIVITAGPKSVTTGTNGTFSVTLEQGDYTVLIRGRDQFTIAVPNDSTTNNVTALTTDGLSYVYTADPGQYPSATSSQNGGVKTDVDSADPVVYLKSSLDALLATNAAPTKLDITNGAAVNLTGSLTNISIYGSTVIDTGDELQDTVDYGYALTPNGNTSTENDASARPRTVATVASLVADVDPLLVPTYARVDVLGYNSAGDGGGGSVRRVLTSSGTTNLGTFFASTANATYAWERVTTGEAINAKWFGAKGDSVTDDTAALDAARDWIADSVRTSGVSTTLYLPRGNYLHSGSFTLSDQIILKGDGLETSGAGNGTSIVCTGDNTPAVVITGQSVQLEDIEVRYQTFQDATKTNSAAIKFDGEIYKFVVRNVAARRAYDAVYGAQAVNVYNGTIDNLFIRSFSHSGLRVLSGGTVNVWNNVYIQNLADVTVLDTAAITNVSLSNGTNIVLTCSGSLPSLLTTNRMFSVTGLDSAYNTKYFVRAISGSDIYCDASSSRSAPVDVTGTVTFFAQPATGYPIELGNGQHVFVGLDVEHVVTDADSIIYAPSYNYVHFVDVHLEALYRSTGDLYMVNSPNGDVAVGSLHMNNLGFNPGSTNYILRTGAETSALIVGNLTARDIASSGSEWYVGSAAAGAEYPMISSRKSPTTFRANANGTPTGDGDLRTVLGGGATTMTIDTDAGLVDVTGTANFSGEFQLTNDAPTITAIAGNGTSGLRVNVFGGSANLVRFQTNSTTTHTFGSDGSITATSATIPTITAGTALNVSGTATLSGSTIISSSTPLLSAIAGNGISGFRIDVTGADANNLVRFQTNGTTTHTFRPNGDIYLTGAIELGEDDDTTLARSAAGVVSIEGTPLIDAGVGTLTYSGTDVTITAGRGALQRDLLTCTNDATLAWTGLAAKDGGTIHVGPAATNCTFTLPSYAFSPTGSTLTISGGTGNTNHTEIAWINAVVGGTNRVSVTALNYYR